MGNPFLGVCFHWLGGLASGSFYVPYRMVRRWSWEVYWLAGGFFSWIIAPWILASINTNDLPSVIASSPASTLFWTFFWGAMWGVGGLTFGLTMRYLGMSLGMAVALSYCSVFGTIVPLIFEGTLIKKFSTVSGLFVLLGIIVCVAGIAVTGAAGMAKDREMPEEQKKMAVKEFNFWRGVIVATFSGIMSSCFAYALDAAEPIAALSAAKGTSAIWTGLPKLCIVLLGGFTTNFVWCSILFFRHGSAAEYLGRAAPEPENAAQNTAERAPLLRNWFFSALAGVTWYLQFFFYTMGETQMGDYKFTSWTLHMASIIIFSSLWGLALREWRGCGFSVKVKLATGLALLIVSTVIIGYGNYLAARH
jgi:L-rhamnose-H+ transport protein